MDAGGGGCNVWDIPVGTVRTHIVDSTRLNVCIVERWQHAFSLIREKSFIELLAALLCAIQLPAHTCV